MKSYQCGIITTRGSGRGEKSSRKGFGIGDDAAIVTGSRNLEIYFGKQNAELRREALEFLVIVSLLNIGET